MQRPDGITYELYRAKDKYSGHRGDIFTDDQLKLFTQQQSRRYILCLVSALRKNQTGNMSSENKYLTLPTDFVVYIS